MKATVKIIPPAPGRPRQFQIGDTVYSTAIEALEATLDASQPTIEENYHA